MADKPPARSCCNAVAKDVRYNEGVAMNQSLVLRHDTRQTLGLVSLAPLGLFGQAGARAGEPTDSGRWNRL
jgi:hypothetical protein